MKIKAIILLLFCLLNLQCNIKHSKNIIKNDFVLYDAMYFANKPNLEEEGLKPIILLYEYRLTKNDPDDESKLILDMNKVSIEATQAAQRPEVVVSADIEQWYDDESVSEEELADRLKTLIDMFKGENPNLKIGNYGVAPSNLNVFRFYDKNETSDSLLIERWRKYNSKRFSAIEHVDIILPPLYIPEPDIESWKKDFISTIEEIKKHDDQKPIIVYIWPAYYDAPWSSFNRLIVDSELWKSILETSYEYADGAIIWSSRFDKNKNVIYWDDPKVQDIWKVTQEFIKDKNLKSKAR